MSNKSKDVNTTSSGQGSQGMGGQPTDDPRDLHGGGGRADDDRGGGTGPIPGANGGAPDGTLGGSAGNETVGPMGDKGITGDLGTPRDPNRGQG